MIMRDHVGNELASELVVGDGVDAESDVEVGICVLEEGLAAADAGVEDQDGGGAEGGAEGGGGLVDGGGGGDVAVVEGDGGGCEGEV